MTRINRTLPAALWGPAAACLLLLPAPAHAAQHTVSPSAPADFTTIGDAVAASSDGDIILVGPGAYPEIVDPLGKAIRVVAEGGPSVTAIQPPNAPSCVRFVLGEGPDTVVAGFRIGGCDLHGVLVEGASPTLRDLAIQSNGSPGGAGGGILVDGGSPTLERVTLQSNEADFGGGLAVYDGAVSAVALSLVDNIGWEAGGGVYLSSSTLSWQGGRLDGNLADGGGGGFSARSTVTLEAVAVSQNTALDEGGGWLQEAGDLFASDTVWELNDARAGGGIRADGWSGRYWEDPEDGVLEIRRSRFVDNLSIGAGAALYVGRSDLLLEDSEVVAHLGGDSAIAGGGGARSEQSPSGLDRNVDRVFARTRFVGNGSVFEGGLGHEAQDLILDCDFTSNGKVSGGPATPHVERGTFRSNFSPSGTLACQGCAAGVGVEAWIHGAVFIDNSGLEGGGALVVSNPSGAVSVSNNLFVGNVSIGAGAVEIDSHNPNPIDLVGNTFVDNSGTSGASTLYDARTLGAMDVTGNLFTYGRGAPAVFSTDYSTYAGNVSFGNAPSSYDLGGPDPATNPATYPGFELYTRNGDRTDDDLRLAPISPLVDSWPAGGLDADGTVADPGAYGGLEPHIHDLDGDGWSRVAGDCMDADPDVHPQAPERANWLDDDCDGFADEGIVDADGDGFVASAELPWFAADCDDGDPSIAPSQPDICDGLDNDCDGLVDEDWDLDGDGWGACGGDCDESDPGTHPGALEPVDGLDNDCDGLIDEPEDLDGDGFTTDGGDCNDLQPAVHPLAAEQPDFLDNDCDGLVDEGLDVDGDGWATDEGDCDDADPYRHPDAPDRCEGADTDCDGALEPAELDADGDGATACEGDCAPQDAAVHPLAVELCNSLDDDCDGVVDGGFDLDLDGLTACDGDCDDSDPTVRPGWLEACDGADNDCDGQADEDFDQDGDGLTTCAGDCDDAEPAVAHWPEICDGLDNDCDGSVDEDFDRDGDGWIACTLGAGPDCDDLDAARHPGAAEACDGLDTDCDGVLDNAPDLDADGTGPCDGDCDDADDAIGPQAPESCDGVDEDCDGEVDDGFDTDQDGSTTCAGDCDDQRAEVHPGAPELCNDLDDDCDGTADEGFDADADGVTSCAGDCDDGDDAVRPGVEELCNHRDDDCDGVADEGFDSDGDGSTTCGGDCEDGDASVHPAAEEVCDGVDNDCDLAIDEGLDEDGDGWTPCAGDADDGDPSNFPGQAQIPALEDPEPASCSTAGGQGSGLLLLLLPLLLRRRSLAILPVAALLLAVPARADTVWVGGSTPDFATLADALAAAQDGDTIYLGTPPCSQFPCTWSWGDVNPGSRDLTIADGFGQSTVDDVTVDQGGSLALDGLYIEGAVVVDSGSLVLTGGQVWCQGSCSAAVDVGPGGSLETFGTQLHSHYTLSGPVLRVAGGEAAVHGGRFMMWEEGPLLQLDGGSVLIDGTDWDSSGLPESATLIAPSPISAGSLTIHDVHWYGDGVVPFRNGGNPVGPGDALFDLSGGELLLDDSLFTSLGGPLIRADGDALVTVANVVATGLSTADSGAFLIAPNGAASEIMLSDLTLLDASAFGDGGALFLAGGTIEAVELVVDGGAADRGGAVAVDGGSLLWTRGGAAGNSANRGGALWVGAGEATLRNVGVTDSQAQQGGAFAVDGGVLDLGFCTVLGSSSLQGGNNLHATGGAWSIDHSAFAFTSGPTEFDGSVPASAWTWVFDQGAPLVVDYEADDRTATDDLWPQAASPLVDAGNPGVLDADGSIADIGLSGGPDGLASDADGDGSVQGADCDDSDPAASPTATELCNLRDDDCDGFVDEGLDVDGDGLTPCAGDCNDGDASIGPGQPEPCDGLDNDCDGEVDDGWDLDQDGVTSCGGDCSDLAPNVSPLAPEVCDGLDNDCDQAVDEDFDGDGDGWGSCLDCDDDEPSANPGESEVCDALDNDCDGVVDDGFDADADGVTACAGDCDDGSSATWPGAEEACDGLDNDCDGHVDEADDCEPPEEPTPGPDPADDDDSASDDDDVPSDDDDASPGDDDDATPDDDDSAAACTDRELCDGVDNDCDGAVDEDFDRDADGFVDCGTGEQNPDGSPRDCRDGDPAVFPGAPEGCNLLDDDCDGEVDEDFDQDGDGWTSCGGDCDDGRAAVFPGAPEDAGTGGATGVDNDCDGVADDGQAGCAVSGSAGRAVPPLLLLPFLLMPRRRRFLMALLLLVPGLASATTWHVDPSGGGDFTDLAAAAAAAQSGDGIEVEAGDYAGPIDFAGRDLRIVGLAGSAATSIDSAAGRTLTVLGGPGGSSIEGFTLRGADGCLLVAGTALDLRDILFSSCGNAGVEGSAAFVGPGTMLVTEDLVVQDTSSLRGAFHLQGAEWTSTNDTFAGGWATDDGGAVYASACDLTFSGATFSGNRADGQGGAVWAEGATFDAVDSTWDGNWTATPQGGEGGGLFLDATEATLVGCAFTNNEAGDSTAGRFVGGALFVAPDSFVQIAGAEVVANEATYAGGIGLDEAATLHVFGSTIRDNVALAYDGIGVGVRGHDSFPSIAPTSVLLVANSTFVDNGDEPLRVWGHYQDGAESVTLDHCSFEANSGAGRVDLSRTASALHGCEFGPGTQLLSSQGDGALEVYGSTFLGAVGIAPGGAPLLVQGSTFVATTANQAIYNATQAVTIRQSDFLSCGNRALNVGAGSLIENNLFVGHTTYAISSSGLPLPTVRHNAFWDNAAVANWFNPIVGVDGNIEADPLLVDFSDDGDASNDDLARLPGSPLFDAGLPTILDEDGTPSDIGARGGPNLAGDFDGDGYGLVGLDCDDSDPTIYPFAPEACDLLDNDCDGLIDEGFDSDGDGSSACLGDCDDSDASVYPGAAEVCDGDDEDCDGLIDEGFDSDGDGVTSCGGDCNEADATAFPGAEEICDGDDEDCDGLVDEGFDGDGDGTAACAGDCDDADPTRSPTFIESCNSWDDDCDGQIDEGFDADGDSVRVCAGDCDDAAATVFAGAPELCDFLDNDCDGLVDEGLDLDGDGFLPCGGDCDDGDPTVSPSSAEACDGVDEDCDGQIDEGVDRDGDGAEACPEQGEPDCDDRAPDIAPGLDETCDGRDNDCDGWVDEDFDEDGDGWATCRGDCDDAAADIAPGLPELCDGLDHDCDGLVDEGCDDPPGDDDDSAISEPCGGPELCNGLDDDCDGLVDEPWDADRDGVTTCAGDCDDAEPRALPGAEEVRDGIDNNCDGVVDEGFEAEPTGCALASSSTHAAWLLLLLVLSCRRPRRRRGITDRRALAGSALVLLVPAAAPAATWVVDPAGAGDFEALQDALDAATDGDTILVEAGTYAAPFDLLGKQLVVESTQGAAATIIDGFLVGLPALSAVSGEPEGTVVRGFTITGGSPGVDIADSSLQLDEVVIEGNLSEDGAGVACLAGDVTLSDSQVLDNTANLAGGGLFLEDCAALLSEVELAGNDALAGGGVAAFGTSSLSWLGGAATANTATLEGGALSVEGADAALESVDFSANEARWGAAAFLGGGGAMELSLVRAWANEASVSGGALFLDSAALVHNSIFDANEAPWGGAIFVQGGAPALSYNHLLSNHADGGGAAVFVQWADGVSIQNSVVAWSTGSAAIEAGSGATALLAWNDVYGTPAGLYGGILSDPTGVDGNLSEAPELLSYSHDGDATNDDLHPGPSSPLRDAGDPADSDPDGSRADIGALGGPGSPDVDADGDGYNASSGDCDDDDPLVGPQASDDSCDGLDNDCDGLVDDGLDSDGDGVTTCGGADCDDSDPAVHPGVPDLCDGLDNDCDGVVDEAADADGDGFSWCAECDDLDPLRNPAAAEVCDGLDNNCDSVVDEGFDGDGDGWATCGPTPWDCDDTDPNARPFHHDSFGFEACDGIDNDCDGDIDERGDWDGDGVTDCEGDCDDWNPSARPGLPDLCDGVDNDCDGSIDEDLDADADGDGHFAPGSCTQPNQDCDDADALTHPGAPEECNGIDDDCDGQIDGQFDQDHDGVGQCSGDCDDLDPRRFDGASEICDGVDNDCDGDVDEVEDVDGDGLTNCDGDCDDQDPAVGPSAAEVCNGVDDNCDGTSDEGFDTDGDGFGACVDCNDADAAISPGSVEICDGFDNDCDGGVDSAWDADADGWSSCMGDCVDGNPTISPGAPEVCNDLDDDCDGVVDEGFDADGDGVTPCGLEADCDDSEPSVHEGAFEGCDGLDNDCDGQADEGWDLDGDGFSPCQGDCDDGVASVSPLAVEACNTLDDDCDGEQDEGFDEDGDGEAPCGLGADCDDSDPALHSGAEEACDGVDQDCDGLIDEGFDADGDGHLGCLGADCDEASAAVHPDADELCNGVDDDCDALVDEDFDLDGDGVRTCEGDCDDNDPERWPGAPELCNALDDDCDGTVDEGLDTDGDGWSACAPITPGSFDCDDQDPSVHPLADEVCDGLDQDCDGRPDDGLDRDGDGVSPCGEDGEPGTEDDDCDDADASSWPGAPERCDGIDNDCDGTSDDGLDRDGDGLSPCEGDCDDNDPATHPGADETGDGVDRDCDGVAAGTGCSSAGRGGGGLGWLVLFGALLGRRARWGGLLMLLAVGCGDVPSEPSSGPASPAAEATAWEHGIQGQESPEPVCALTWLGPEPERRSGQEVVAMVEVDAPGAALELRAWSENGSARVPGSAQDVGASRYRVEFEVPKDDTWTLCVACVAPDGAATRLCTEGWEITNVRPEPVTNFRWGGRG